MAWRKLLWVIIVGVLLGLGIFLYRSLRPTSNRSTRVIAWLNDRLAHPDWAVHAGLPCSPDAPFLMPTDGLIGYLWDDSFRPGHRHSGLDIFGGTGVGVTPVVAAYAGYVTRLSGWVSAVIERLPQDPLEPGRQIWLYYTHMADANGVSFISPDFPPGTSEVYVEAGTLLGYQGNYTGDANSPAGVHLHFSIVRDDGRGGFTNELDIRNTYDPSPYFGIDLDARTASDTPRLCPEQSP